MGLALGVRDKFKLINAKPETVLCDHRKDLVI